MNSKIEKQILKEFIFFFKKKKKFMTLIYMSYLKRKVVNTILSILLSKI